METQPNEKKAVRKRKEKKKNKNRIEKRSDAVSSSILVIVRFVPVFGERKVVEKKILMFTHCSLIRSP